MSVRSHLQDRFTRLRSQDTRTREVACAELGDFFEYDVGRGGYAGGAERKVAFAAEIRDATAALINVAVSDTQLVVVETALHALECAVDYANAEQADSWEILAQKLHRFVRVSDLDTALYCLANTGDLKVRPAVAALTQDERSEIRTLAAGRLDLLDKYINIAAGRRAFASGFSEAQALAEASSVLPHFEASCVVLGYYVKDSEMGERDALPWQTFRAALRRLGLQDAFTRPAITRPAPRC